jgi:hypothetical protein
MLTKKQRSDAIKAGWARRKAALKQAAPKKNKASANVVPLDAIPGKPPKAVMRKPKFVKSDGDGIVVKGFGFAVTITSAGVTVTNEFPPR